MPASVSSAGLHWPARPNLDAQWWGSPPGNRKIVSARKFPVKIYSGRAEGFRGEADVAATTMPLTTRFYPTPSIAGPRVGTKGPPIVRGVHRRPSHSRRCCSRQRAGRASRSTLGNAKHGHRHGQIELLMKFIRPINEPWRTVLPLRASRRSSVPSPLDRL